MISGLIKVDSTLGRIVQTKECLPERGLTTTRWAKQGKEPFSIRVGLNSGRVVAGNMGAAGKKMEYTVIGDTVNLAARLESTAKIYGVTVLVGMIFLGCSIGMLAAALCRTERTMVFCGGLIASLIFIGLPLAVVMLLASGRQPNAASWLHVVSSFVVMGSISKGQLLRCAPFNCLFNIALSNRLFIGNQGKGFQKCAGIPRRFFSP